MRIAVGNDHAGYPLRGAVLEVIESWGHEVLDFGTAEQQSCDYPDYACQVAEAVRDGDADLGVLMCGTGLGMAITANKVRGVYAAPCSDTYSARMARSHNAANVLTMGERVVGPGLAQDILTVFLQTEISPEAKHQRRREKVTRLEATGGCGMEDDQ